MSVCVCSFKAHNVRVHRAAANKLNNETRATRGSVCNALLSSRFSWQDDIHAENCRGNFAVVPFIKIKPDFCSSNSNAFGNPDRAMKNCRSAKLIKAETFDYWRVWFLGWEFDSRNRCNTVREIVIIVSARFDYRPAASRFVKRSNYNT